MSTRSRIGLKLPSGQVKSIYCHFDGYPSGVGATLINHYDSPEKVAKLLELGDISSLGEEYDAELARRLRQKQDKGEEYTEEEKEREGRQTFPYRDRGEKKLDARLDKDEWEFLDKLGRCCEEYTYLYKKDYTGVYRWHFVETPYFRTLRFKDILEN